MPAILWDLDGTLADTESLHFRAWQATMEQYKIDYTYEEFLAGFGRSNSEILPVLLGVAPDSERVGEVAERKEEMFRRLLESEDLLLLPGVHTWLHAFEQADIPQVISSSGSMANISMIIAKLGIGDRFLSLLSGARLPEGKPHPSLFLNSAAAVNTPPVECLVIEDSEHGVEAARRAGMACVVVGKLATAPALDRVLARVEGPSSLRMENLENLTWEACERLWKEARAFHHDKKTA